MSYELTAKRIEMSVEDAKKLRALMPTKFLPHTGELLFGIRIVPNRTLKDGQFIVDYGEGACQFVNTKEEQNNTDTEACEDDSDAVDIDDPQAFWGQVKLDTNVGEQLPAQEKYNLFMQAYEQCHSAGYYTTLRRYEDLLEEAILQRTQAAKEDSGLVTCIRGKPIEPEDSDEFDFEAVSECVKDNNVTRTGDVVASKDLCWWLPHGCFQDSLYVWPNLQDTPVDPIARDSRTARSMYDARISLFPAPTIGEILHRLVNDGHRVEFIGNHADRDYWQIQDKDTEQTAIGESPEDAALKLWYLEYMGHEMPGE